jgi:phospholipase/lecithinase/hemolysin
LSVPNKISGDSWSRIGFNVSKTQPSDSNAFGNTGSTSSNGLNWVYYLTRTYNSSLFWTYDFAQSGATIDEDIVAGTSGKDVDSELNDVFLPNYASQDSFYQGSTSLFAIWIGVNDLTNSYLVDEDVHPALFTRLRQLVNDMYEAGARQFIFINAPPLERVPKVTGSSSHATRIPLMKTAVTDYNRKMYELAREVNHDLAYTEVVHFDVYTLMNAVIDNPTQFDETAVYKDTTSYCAAYQDGTEEYDTKLADCDYAANEYLWINNLHPTQPFHQLLAKNLAEVLRNDASI